MRDGIVSNPEKMREYERAGHLGKDIVSSRLKKIVSLASASAQSESGLRNLAGEERFLYEKLFRVVNQWKTLILEHKEGT
jgi:DNA replication initiation complex subunit (GINS family)